MQRDRQFVYEVIGRALRQQTGADTQAELRSVPRAGRDKVGACIPEYRQLTATACKRVSQQEIELADLVAAVIGSGKIVALDIDLLRIRQHLQRRGAADQIGRASCRERVCPYV